MNVLAMKNKPVVLIVSRRLVRKNKPVNWVSEAHMSMLMQQGVIPIVVPIVEETLNYLEGYMSNMSGLLMVEGGDIMSSYYGQVVAIEDMDEPDAIKDEIEIAIFKRALETEVPVLGICRGIQIINALCGGTLSNRDNSSVLHMNYDNYDGHRHKVTIEKNTPLFDWYNQTELMVNTYHHMGIDKIAPGFKPMAYTDDGLIEGIIHEKHRFLVGLQFHPERMLNDYPGNRKVFEAFGKAVNTYCSSEKQK